MDSYAPPGEVEAAAIIGYMPSTPSSSYAPIVYVGGLQSGQPEVDNRSVQLIQLGQSRRKEKARIAARARRSQESSIIMEMAQELLVTPERMRRIDKATIVRLAIDYIRAHEALCRASCLAHGAEGRAAAIERPLVLRQSPIIICSQPPASGRKQQLDLSSSSSSSHHKQASKYQRIDNNNDAACQSLVSSKENYQQQQQQQQPQVGKLGETTRDVPKSITSEIFAPKTSDNINANYLMIEDTGDGKTSFVLKPDTEISDDDDLTHLAPQAGDISISLAPGDSPTVGGFCDLLEPPASRRHQREMYSIVAATNDIASPSQQHKQLPPATQTAARGYLEPTIMYNTTNCMRIM